MAYRFARSDRSMTDAVRRIAAEEFAHVRSALADKALPLDRKVHEGRKATKPLRALLRLTAPVLPGAHDEIAALRAAAGQLSALRDKGALQETLAGLELGAAVTGALSEALASSTSVSAASQRRLLAAFGRDMKTIAARAEFWTLEAEGWKALAPGVKRCQHRLRRSMAAARSAKSEEPVHEFRKRAKDHWYQTLLLRAAFPEMMEAYAEAGERLGNDLGLWRDLGLLEEAVGALPAHVLPADQLSATLSGIAKARRRALRRAFRIAARLAWETPGDHAARLKAWWKAAR